MSEHAASYFSKLSDTIPTHTRQRWDTQIILAEQNRRQKRSSMDILGAHEPKNPGESVSADKQAEVGPHTQWIEVAMEIQEKQ